MTDSKLNSFNLGHRPRSKEFLRLDLENSYTRLGISPLETTDEIERIIKDLRGKANKALKRQGDSDNELEEEIFRLDKIHAEIGTPNARKKYDEDNPQNILLTLQPSPTEQSWLQHRLDGLISEWLLEELGQDAIVSSFHCLKFWSPQPLNDTLLNFLAQFTHSESADAEKSEQPSFSDSDEDELKRSMLEELNRLI